MDYTRNRLEVFHLLEKNSQGNKKSSSTNKNMKYFQTRPGMMYNNYMFMKSLIKKPIITQL